METLVFYIRIAFEDIYSGWIALNLFLAFIPLALSFWLFQRKNRQRDWFWWLVFLVFVAFLPNAPYVLTDIIHLLRGVQAGHSFYIITLIFIPLHLIAIVLGFEAYVVSLIKQGNYLKRQGAKQYVLWSELLAHALCAIGIYIGRFLRFNSWDLVSSPGNVVMTTMNELTQRRPLVVVMLTFIILAGLYWSMKQITLGLVLRVRYGYLLDQMNQPPMTEQQRQRQADLAELKKQQDPIQY